MWGAYSNTQPGPGDLVPPPDGFATQTRPAKEDAVRFLIETIHRYPHEVTILAIGPLTNLALAMPVPVQFKHDGDHDGED
jgi:purine nucleosidase